MWWFLIILVVILAIVKNQYDLRKDEERGEQLSETMADFPDFKPSVIVTGYQNKYSFSWDNTHRKILYIDENKNIMIPFDEVISYEVKEDNNVIMSKSMLRTIGGGVVGGLVAGGVGALIGGLSGSQKEKHKISRIDVILRIRNLSTPSLVIRCFDSISMTDQGGEGLMANDYIIGLIKDDITSICDILSVIIDENKHSNQIDSSSYDVNKSNIDELEKLVSLKERGVLSDEEFQKMKKKLI